MDYNARYYSPCLGRFISPDSVVPKVENPQHWNRYSYVYNNPLKLIDPTGHTGCTVGGPSESSVDDHTIPNCSGSPTGGGSHDSHGSGSGGPGVRNVGQGTGSSGGTGSTGNNAASVQGSTANTNSSTTLKLKYKPDWNQEQMTQADGKVGALNKAAQEGRLVKTQVQRSGSSASNRYSSTGQKIPKNHDVDHIQDLQLGGKDTTENMAPLDLSVNRSLGSQIYHQIRELPIGTIIDRVIIE
jgi:hypothetical protein